MDKQSLQAAADEQWAIFRSFRNRFSPESGRFWAVLILTSLVICFALLLGVGVLYKIGKLTNTSFIDAAQTPYHTDGLAQ